MRSREPHDDPAAAFDPAGDALELIVEQLAAAAIRQSPSIAPGTLLVDRQVGDVRCIVVAQSAAREVPTLSPREREIATMVAQGYPNKTIAAALLISSWTVSTYLRRIFAKLDVHSRTAMVARLIEQGMISQGRATTVLGRSPGLWE